jgi:hypothetical protein
MTTTHDPDIERVLDVWLADGPTQMPDRFFGEVLGRVERQPQRRLARLLPRSLHMNLVRYAALGAAALLILALIGVAVTGGGRREPTAPPTPTPLPSAATLPASDALVPGRYAWDWSGGRLSFSVPAGWSARYDGLISKDAASILPWLPGTRWEVSRVFGDACHPTGTSQRIGSSVDELLTALDAQTSTDASVSDVVIGGRSGHRVVMTISPSVDIATCEDGAQGPAKIWTDSAEQGYFAFPFDTPGGGTAYVVDVDGKRVAFIPGAFIPGTQPGVSAADRAELDAIIASMAFEQAEPSG